MSLLAIGTSIGGATLVGDTLLRGHIGAAGEFAHIPMHGDGLPCLAAHGGCQGGWLGGQGIAVRARQRVADSPGSVLWRLAGGTPAAIEATQVFEAARAGDAVAKNIVTEVCVAVGMTLAAVMHSVNPALVVVTGGVAKSLVPLESEIRRHAARYALPRVFATTRIAIVAGDKRRSFVGGAALVPYEVGRRAASISATR